MGRGFVGDRYLAGAFDNLNAGVSNFFEAQRRDKERLKQEGQEATSLRKLLGVVLPERKGEFDVMGLPDLRGELQGYSLAELAKDRRSGRALVDDRLKGRERFMEGLNKLQRLQGLSGVPTVEAEPDEGSPFRETPAPMMVDPDLPVLESMEEVSPRGYRPLGPDEQSLARLAMMELTPEDFENFARGRSLLAEANEGGRNRLPAVADLAGRSVVYSPHTGQFQVLPGEDVEVPVDPTTGESLAGLAMIGGRPVRLPTDRTAQDLRSEADTFAKLNEQLIEIDRELRLWERNQDQAGTDKRIRRRTVDEKRQLERQKASVLSMLKRLEGGDNATGTQVGRAQPKTATSSEKVIVEKNGKKYRLPKEQLSEAVRQGFREVK